MPKRALPLPDGLPERLTDQLSWYDHQAQSLSQTYRVLKVIQLISGGLIPILALAPGMTELKIGAAVLGVVISAIEGYLQMSQMHDLTIRYRATAESLKREAYLFASKAGPYRAQGTLPDATTLLSERIEDVMASEQQSWVALQNSSKSAPPGMPK